MNENENKIDTIPLGKQTKRKRQTQIRSKKVTFRENDTEVQPQTKRRQTQIRSKKVTFRENDTEVQPQTKRRQTQSKSIKKQPVPGRNAASKLRLKELKGASNSIKKVTTARTSTRIVKDKMFDLKTLNNIYNFYITIVARRHITLGSDVSSDLSDEEVNSIYVKKMKEQLPDERQQKFQYLLEILNYVCGIGRGLNFILENRKNARVYNLIKNHYVIPQGRVLQSQIANFGGKNWNIVVNKRTRWFTSQVPKRGLFKENTGFLDNILYNDELLRILSFLQSFKETNDILSKLNIILKDKNNVQHELLGKLFNLNEKSSPIKFLQALRSGVAKHPKTMANASVKGPRHHVQPQSQLVRYIRNVNTGRQEVYVGKPLSLPSILFLADAMLLKKSGLRLINKGGVHNYRGKGDKPILRQEPSLLKPPEELERYFLEINRCSTSWRHGAIHCALVNVGYNTTHGVTNTRRVQTITDMLELMVKAYAKEDAPFDFPDFLVHLDSSYQPIFFSDKKQPIALNSKPKNLADLEMLREKVDKRQFFQSFKYIFKEGSEEVDILKEISLKLKNDTTRDMDFSKTFAIQTTGQNMNRFLTMLYTYDAVDILTDKSILSIIRSLSRSYEKGKELTENEIRSITNLLEKGKNKNTRAQAQRELVEMREKIWKELS